MLEMTFKIKVNNKHIKQVSRGHGNRRGTSRGVIVKSYQMHTAEFTPATEQIR